MLPDFPTLKAEVERIILTGLRQRVRRGDPILSKIKGFTQHEGTQLRYEQQGGTTVQEGFEKIGMEFQVPIADIPDLAGEKLNAKLDEMARELTSQEAKAFFKKMGEICEAAGTSLDAGGQPATPEMLLDMMDKVQMEFEPDGKPSQSFVVHPDTVPALQKIAEQIENDPKLKRRNEEILERQREAWLARESNRKLAD
jgi:DNA topoisomerase IB